MDNIDMNNKRGWREYYALLPEERPQRIEEEKERVCEVIIDGLHNMKKYFDEAQLLFDI